MNSQQRRPRRPAMLDPADAEQIVGDSDPAEMSAIAHSSAWALMGVSDDDFGPDEIERLRTTVRTEGVDVLTDMWSRSPEFTLPGALWRLYLWSRWYHRDTALVRDRFVRGSHADIIPGLEHPVDIPDLEHVVHEVDQLLEGRRHDWLTSLLQRHGRCGSLQLETPRAANGSSTRGTRWHTPSPRAPAR